MILNPTSKNSLKKKILKRFEDFKDVEFVESALFLKGIDFGFDYGSKKFVYPQDANTKALVSMPSKGIKSYSALARELRNNPDFAFQLGYDEDDDGSPVTPDKRTLRHFDKFILTDEQRELIRFVGKEIMKLAEKYNISFGDTLDVKKIEAETPWAVDYRLLDVKKEVCKMAKKTLVNGVKFAHVGRNMRHDMEEYMKFLTDMAHTRGFAESCHLSHKDDVETGKTTLKLPASDSVLRHIRKWEENPDEMRQMFISQFDSLLDRTKNIKKLFGNGSVNIAIDPTQIRYFGDKEDTMVVGRSKKNPEGTKWAHEYIAMSIINKNTKYIILAVPVKYEEDKVEIIRDMLIFAKRRFRIGYVVMDREFSNEAPITMIMSLGLKFVFIAKRQKNVNRIIRQAYTLPYSQKGFKIFDDYDLKVNAIVVKGRKKDKEGKDKRIVYITNANFEMSTSDQNTLANRFDTIYRRRWRIEDAFNKVKQFLPRTTSTSHTLRYFYFLFSCLIYNLWILAKCIINICKFGRTESERRLIEKIFIKKVVDLMCLDT